MPVGHTGRGLNGLIKSMLGEVACTLRAVGDVVIVDGEVEGKTEASGMRGLERSQRVFVRSLVRVQ